MLYPPRFVITGMGHSATGYISRVLIRCGILCSHEGFFAPCMLHLVNEEFWGDSSWLFGSSLEYQQAYLRGCDILGWKPIVVYQKRDEDKVIASYLRTEYFRKPYNTYVLFNFKHFPEIEEQPTETKRAEKYIELQDKRIMELKPNLIYNVEEMNPDLLIKLTTILGYPIDKQTAFYALNNVPKTANKHDGPVTQIYTPPSIHYIRKPG